MKKYLILLADLLVSDNDFALEFSSKENVDEKFKLVKTKFNNFEKEDFLEFLDILESLEKANKKLSLKELESISGGVGNNKIKLAALTFLGLTLLPMGTSGIAWAQLPDFYTDHTLELTPEETKKVAAYDQFLELIKNSQSDDVLSRYKGLVERGDLPEDSDIMKDGNFNPDHPAVKVIEYIKALTTPISAFNSSEFGKPYFEAYEENRKSHAYLKNFLPLIKNRKFDAVLSRYKDLIDRGELPKDPDIMKDGSFNPEHPAVKAVNAAKAAAAEREKTMVDVFNKSEFGKPYFEASAGTAKAKAYKSFFSTITSGQFENLVTKYNDQIRFKKLPEDSKFLLENGKYNPEHPLVKLVADMKASMANDAINAFNSSDFGKPFFEASQLTVEDAEKRYAKAQAYKSFLGAIEKNNFDDILKTYRNLIRFKKLPEDYNLTKDGTQLNPEHPLVKLLEDIKALSLNTTSTNTTPTSTTPTSTTSRSTTPTSTTSTITTPPKTTPISVFNSSEFVRPYFEAYEENRKADAYLKNFLPLIKNKKFDDVLSRYKALIDRGELPADPDIIKYGSFNPEHPAVKAVNAAKAAVAEREKNMIDAFNKSEFGKPYFEASAGTAKAEAYKIFLERINNDRFTDIPTYYNSLLQAKKLPPDPKFLMENKKRNPEHPAVKFVEDMKASIVNDAINAFNSSDFGKPYFEASQVTGADAEKRSVKAQAYKSFLGSIAKNIFDNILRTYRNLICSKKLPEDSKFLLENEKCNPEHPLVKLVADIKALSLNTTSTNTTPTSTTPTSTTPTSTTSTSTTSTSTTSTSTTSTSTISRSTTPTSTTSTSTISRSTTPTSTISRSTTPTSTTPTSTTSTSTTPTSTTSTSTTSRSTTPTSTTPTNTILIRAFNSSAFGKPYFEAYERRAKILAQRAYYRGIYSEIRKVIDNGPAINSIFGKKQKLVIKDNGCTYTLRRAAFQHIIYGTYDPELAFHISGGHTEKALDLMKRINLAKLDSDAEKNPFRDEYISSVLKVDKSKALEPSKVPFYDDVIRGKKSVMHKYHFLDSSDAISSLSTSRDVARKNFFPKEWDEKTIWEKIQYCVLNGEESGGASLAKEATIKYSINGIDYTMKMRVHLSNSNEILTAYPLSITQE